MYHFVVPSTEEDRQIVQDALTARGHPQEGPATPTCVDAPTEALTADGFGSGACGMRREKSLDFRVRFIRFRYLKRVPYVHNERPSL